LGSTGNQGVFIVCVVLGMVLEVLKYVVRVYASEFLHKKRIDEVKVFVEKHYKFREEKLIESLKP
jgi:hypothetical protein